MKVINLPQIEWPAIAFRKRRDWPALLVAIAVLLATEALVRFAEPSLPPPLDWPTEEMQDKYAQIYRLAETGGEVEVVFVGSSVAFEGIDPVAFTEASDGLRAYNAGIPAASLREVQLWTSEVVIPRLRPESVVVALTSVDVNQESGAEFRELLLASRGYRQATQPGGENLANRLERLLERHLALFRMRTVLRDPVKAVRALALGDRAPELGPVGPFGQEPAGREDPDYSLTDSLARRIRENDLADFSVSEAQLEGLGDLVTDLHRRQVEVFLVLMPVTDDYQRLHPRGASDYAGFVSALEAFGAQRDVMVLDLGNTIDSLQLFRDPSHLNPEGAERFSALLAETLGPRLRP
ncbi:MAG: hypothetical protein ACRD02_08715 [Acidimicrobiia bacterium]